MAFYEISEAYEQGKPASYLVEFCKFERGSFAHRHCGIGEKVAEFPKTPEGRAMAEELVAKLTASMKTTTA